MRPLVILHGVFGSSRNWKSVSRKLVDESLSKAIYPIDLRNHNCTNNPNEHCGAIESWGTFQTDLEAFWKSSLNGIEFDLIGHSFGGQVAMSSVLRKDSRLREAVKKLVIVDIGLKHPSQGKPVDHTFELMKIMLEINEKKFTKRSDVIKHLKIIENNESIVGFLLMNLVSSEEGFFTFGNLALDHLIDAWPRLKQEWTSLVEKDFVPWKGNVLFLKGERSDYMKDDSDIFRLFPKAKIEVIKNAGHWPHFDNPTEFINKLKAFIE